MNVRDERDGPDAPDGAGRPVQGGPPGRWRRPDASMSLLSDLFEGRLADPGYAAAAARRRAAGNAPAPRRLRAVVALSLLLVGVLLAVAGAQVRRGEPVAARQRARLVDEIHSRTRETDALSRRLDRLRTETSRLRAAALARSAAGRRADRDLAAAETAAAARPAAGPALVVTLDDARRPGASGAAGDDGRVYDQDLQILVNGLWAAGATAVGINGLRLTPTSAIRTAGEAVLVDYRPLTGPYQVTALGDPGALRAGFTGSAADQRLAALRDRYGLRYGVADEGRARLPAAAPSAPRYARPAGEKE
ncbi:DUF881 domain-containing protein [Actinomadura rupiterrae]|uniref:DUF881 domain-containing protein n=1 Tax=Actinomadura rupiterrae TaxID=559627 RepID=UPI0027E35294|nr:DUF881 domain-containing protein [Actinomadura rupiterrae]MCP2341790.1 uncharacterized protein YlxW (UPF0749 family) [Actinomadura rupiterrae]